MGALRRHKIKRQTSYLLICALIQVILLVAFDQLWYRNASAAGPWVLVADGDLIEEPVIIGEWQEIQLLFLSHPSVGPTHLTVTMAHLEQRPYFRLSIFAANKWQGWVVEGRPLEALMPEAADYRRRFYPASDDEPALLTDDPVLPPGYSQVPASQIVGEEGIEVLARYGIPTHVEGEWTGGFRTVHRN